VVAAHLATLIEAPDAASVRDVTNRLEPFIVPIETGDGKPLLLVR